MISARLRAIGFAGITTLIFIEGASAYHMPRHGRWLSRDPIGEAGGMNLYAAFANNPASYVDPHGQAIVGLTGYAAAGYSEIRSMGKRMSQQVNEEMEALKKVHRFEYRKEDATILNGHNADNLFEVARKAEEYRRNRFPNGVRRKCYVEGLILFGYSDGAMTLYQLFEQGLANKSLQISAGRYAGVSYIGFIDMVRHSKDVRFATEEFETEVKKAGKVIGLRDSFLIKAGETHFQTYSEPANFFDLLVVGWKGYERIGPTDSWETSPANHMTIVRRSKLQDHIVRTAVTKYMDHIREQITKMHDN